jgi:hypothetical protein
MSYTFSLKRRYMRAGPLGDKQSSGAYDHIFSQLYAGLSRMIRWLNHAAEPSNGVLKPAGFERYEAVWSGGQVCYTLEHYPRAKICPRRVVKLHKHLRV